MSRPRPIHRPHREIRSTPDPAEPIRSYDDRETFFFGNTTAEDVEDEFHRRLAASGSRRDSSGSHGGGGGGGGSSSVGGSGGSSSSFWRSPSSAAAAAAAADSQQQAPSFNSVSLRGKSTDNVKERKSSGLAAALQTHNNNSETNREGTHAPNAPSNSNNGHVRNFRPFDSSVSISSTGSGNNNPSSGQKAKKKDVSKKRAADRRHKLDSQSSDIDIGHIVDEEASAITSSPPLNFGDMGHVGSLDRSSSDQSTGSLLYGKTPSSGGLLGKNSSLIFPTGVEAGDTADASQDDSKKRRKVNLLLDQCEAVRFPFKKKLMLNNLDLRATDIPLKYLCGTSLGNSLHKLSLAGNPLGGVPPKLVVSLPTLKHLDLSQCGLHQLPAVWNLPKLLRLILSNNRFTEFPEESMLEGLPELQELNMYGNKVAEIIVPTNPKLLTKLETLNLGFNDLVYLPDDLDRLKSLKNLKVMNNFLNKVPPRICDMDLRTIDVSSNPVTEPPIETCDRGICSMKRYWHCIRMEEQSKQKALEEVQRKVQRQKKKGKKSYSGLLKSLPRPCKTPSPSSSRKVMDEQAPSLRAVSSLSAQSSQPSDSIASDVPVVVKAKSPPSKEVRRSSPAQASTIAIPEIHVAVPLDHKESTDELVDSAAAYPLESIQVPDQVTVNNNLKVIFVGMALVGKTSMIKRLIEGKDAVIPTHDERTVGVDIYEWDPKQDKRFEHIDSRIEFQDKELGETCGDVDVKFSVWDFAGQHVYHATHELFFSSRALYVLVWDMGATSRATIRRKSLISEETGAFRLTYDSSDDEDEPDESNDFAAEEEARRADRALERDIDEKVQFWVDCIQSSAPGAAILPVASFADYFANEGGEAEAKRRCGMLKKRLLKHEERRIQGIRERLKEYEDQNRSNDPAAVRLRKLLCPYTRPKLIFGDDDENSVVRVSGTEYTGFDHLTEKIIGIATGRDKGRWPYPVFHGHVGARIPRMRLEVREAVRTMRDRFKVVEWGYFINQLRDLGLTSVEDISDALHFLTNTGELSYFGGVMTDNQRLANPLSDGVSTMAANLIPVFERSLTLSYQCALQSSECNPLRASQGVKSTTDDASSYDVEDDDVDDDNAVLSIDDTSITAPSTEDGSLTTVEDFMSSGLSQFVFLNPRWLVAAVACILRHDLDREIKETRKVAASGGRRSITRDVSFYDAHLNCPVITADDACLLWQTKRITKKAAERAQEYSNNMTVTPFEFLQLLLIRFGVFVPIDLSIEKAFLGGKEYAQLVDSMSTDLLAQASPSETPPVISIEDSPDESARKAKFFFLPSLLGPCEPSDAWTYKNTDSWKTTLCHSILFPDGVPPGLMERLTASVLSSVYAVTNREEDLRFQDCFGREMASYEGRLTVKEILCWRTAFFIKIGTLVPTTDGTKKESIVEIFTHLADRDSHLCVGSDYMGVGMRRLITSARGQVGDGGRKIWKGGYLIVVKCIRRVMEAYGGLEFEKQGFCPECLAKKAVSEASCWDLTVMRSAVVNNEDTIRCQYGHRVETRLVAGPVYAPQKPRLDLVSSPLEPIVPVRDLLRAVVVVGLWDGKSNKVVRVGSGFVVDRKRGLIVTASHTLMNIWGDKKSPFGENYYGLRQGKVVIGVIPQDKDSDGANGKDMAVFRYFAKIVARDPSLDRDECHLDACVLRITTRMENDVGGEGEGCGDQPETLLLNDPRAMKNERLQALKITEKYELDEQVRIIGYNQGGEGLLKPGESLNRYVDFARGYVCKKFARGEDSGRKFRDRFKPREEIVVICPTIGGHSGGPCVNQQGEVIGILSRADQADNQRCYIAPTYEWKSLVKEAKNKL